LNNECDPTHDSALKRCIFDQNITFEEEVIFQDKVNFTHDDTNHDQPTVHFETGVRFGVKDSNHEVEFGSEAMETEADAETEAVKSVDQNMKDDVLRQQESMEEPDVDQKIAHVLGEANKRVEGIGSQTREGQGQIGDHVTQVVYRPT
jgi:hypothetical protein